MEDWIWILVPMTALMIPIVAIFVSHQQRMAQILHRSSADTTQIDALRKELAELRALVQSQTIAIDNLAVTQKSLGASQSVVERLS